MKRSTDEVADMVFKRSEHAPENARNFDTHTFNVFMAIDGIRTVRTIAKDDFYKLEDLVDVMMNLLDQDLIKPASARGLSHTSQVFFQKLEGELNRILGPIGHFLIEDHVIKLGYNTSNFPMDKVYDLIVQISQALEDTEKAEAFIKSMNNVFDR